MLAINIEYIAGVCYADLRAADRAGLDAVVVGAQLQLAPEDPKALKREVRDHLRWRKSGTPFDEPCCGSVFRNPSEADVEAASAEVPEPCTAGRLLDAAGLKGYRIGGAEVSTKHANFIINREHATAGDIEALIEHVRLTVLEVHGVSLQHEVRIVGEAQA